MNIAAKLSHFRDAGKLDAAPISIHDIECHGIRRQCAGNLNYCYFEDGAQLSSPVIASSRCSFIGAYSYMNDGGYMRENVFIGRYCSIGRRVTIGAGMHSTTGLSSSPAIRNGTARPYNEEERKFLLGEREVRSRFTVVDNDVWVGDGAIIMPGVYVGVGAVVGANAVVTKDIPPYGIAVGAPARVIKLRFPSDVINGLLRSEWWELTPDCLQQLPTGNVFEFVESVMDCDHLERQSFDTYILTNP
ncbi:Acetyltransferase (isoleucine patch superfamily) [Paraburkholderia susongensis]|uniref:Acetyltransferase (Isoleucine patch superfamily) n=2 Tax=Paraburkholderia susongensis TaxID=1515439 RepID=A0A1X7LT58_9BURK|nr:Acetyltransferase (isoleucine patch superfamily) [Paraburkholderia susongensis]